MTLEKKVSIKCGNCGEVVDMELYDSVNVTEDPELKQRVIDRKINGFTCSKCGTTGELAYPFLYHDMEGKQMIWVYPESARKNAEAIKQKKMKEFEILIPAHRALVSEPSIVFGYDELLAIIKP